MVEAIWGADKESDGVSLPYEMISLPEEMGKEGWFLDPVARKMIRLPNNTEVVRVTDPDSDGRVIIKYPDGYALIPQEYVIEIGFN